MRPCDLSAFISGEFMRKWTGAIVLVTTAVVAGCSSDSSPQANDYWMMGNWTLQTLNGAPLPYVMQASGTDTVYLTKDIFTGTDHGTFSEAVTTRTVSSGQATTQTATTGGAYALDGTTVTLQYGNSPALRGGTVSQTTLTIQNLAGTYVFTK